MEALIVILKMGMAKTEHLIGMEAHEVVATGLELEGQLAMREETTEIDQHPMIALEGEFGPLHLIVTD